MRTRHLRVWQRLDRWIHAHVDGVRSAGPVGPRDESGRAVLARMARDCFDDVTFETLESYVVYWSLYGLHYDSTELPAAVADAVRSPTLTEDAFEAIRSAGGSGGGGDRDRGRGATHEDEDDGVEDRAGQDPLRSPYKGNAWMPVDQACARIVEKLESARLWGWMVDTRPEKPTWALIQTAKNTVRDALPTKPLDADGEAVANGGASGAAEDVESEVEAEPTEGPGPDQPATDQDVSRTGALATGESVGYGEHQRLARRLTALREAQEYARALRDVGDVAAGVPLDPYDRAIDLLHAQVSSPPPRMVTYRLGFLFRKLFPFHSWEPSSAETPRPAALGSWALSEAGGLDGAVGPSGYWLPRAAAIDLSLARRLAAAPDSAFPAALYEQRARWHFAHGGTAPASEEAALLSGCLDPGLCGAQTADSAGMEAHRQALQRFEQRVSVQNRAACARLDEFVLTLVS